MRQDNLMIGKQDHYPHSHSETIPLDSLEGVLQAIQRMDIDSLEKAIKDGVLYSSELGSEALIAQLKIRIGNLRSTGNVQLKLLRGKCAGACDKGVGYCFEGNHTGSRLNYIINSSYKEKIELYMCICFHVDGETPPDPF